MTRYEQGFMNKCAEYGVKKADAKFLLANYGPETLGGALLGGGVGALTSKKHRMRNAVIGALLGGGVGAGARYALAGQGISGLNELFNLSKNPEYGIEAQDVPFWKMRLPFNFDHMSAQDKARFLDAGE